MKKGCQDLATCGMGLDLQKEREMSLPYDAIIGLEVHAQLETHTKLFCGCAVEFGAQPNSRTCPVCLGMPGTLPVINEKAVEYALKMILAVGGTVHLHSEFARKNYFYPDLPKGYQISQNDKPIGTEGQVVLDDGFTIRINRIHLEEDAGKSLHPESGESFSRIDLNRCGTPLIEIVTEPDLRTAEQAYEYLTKIRQLVRYLGICSGDMEKGALRCDANISLRPKGEDTLGVKTELKNLNSIRAVKKALEFEIIRQTNLLESGQNVIQDTRLWDESTLQTESMRVKEEADDYRYFPEPDLPPLVLTNELVKSVRKSLPELPEAKKNRLITEYKISEYDAGVISKDTALAAYFEVLANETGDSALSANWLMNIVLQVIGELSLEVDAFPIPPWQLAELLTLQKNGTISAKNARDIFAEMLDTGRSPSVIMEARGLTQVSDEREIEGIIDDILAARGDMVEAYRQGRVQLFDFFVGQVMKATKGRANPAVVTQVLKDKLNGR
ncbi:MAG: Asp-tRNA(Asn)/Glu-tRNA(Gln) amidotransferase subunit GatB [Candidatus Zixiibacteriota bacterium]